MTVRISGLFLGEVSGECWEKMTALQISYANLMLPLREFDDITIPKLIKRIDVTDKEHIKVIFCGGMETEVTVEK